MSSDNTSLTPDDPHSVQTSGFDELIEGLMRQVEASVRVNPGAAYSAVASRPLCLLLSNDGSGTFLQVNVEVRSMAPGTVRYANGGEGAARRTISCAERSDF